MFFILFGWKIQKRLSETKNKEASHVCRPQSDWESLSVTHLLSQRPRPDVQSA